MAIFPNLFGTGMSRDPDRQTRPDRSRQADEFVLTVSYKETTKGKMSTPPPGGALRYVHRDCIFVISRIGGISPVSGKPHVIVRP
ncbi:hypothetical protein JTE90_014635 [Oedothorax gibbosus]|uniref:Uncharacterized protein n=1 Tax=Oedothorax gibbosus TaxID=931172 RepID=A0AAV6V8B5_9ARAC|nr:hypothetical protein JTE90_014635 [Oedothorax gibbosus]